MSLRVVRGLVEAVEQVGVSREELLWSAELDPAELDDEEACVPRSVVYTLCEHALDLTSDPAFGLHWVERLCGTAFQARATVSARHHACAHCGRASKASSARPSERRRGFSPAGTRLAG